MEPIDIVILFWNNNSILILALLNCGSCIDKTGSNEAKTKESERNQ
jgi:hypothetical protein